MPESAQGIPNLPDLTHPQELIQFGTELLKLFPLLVVLVGFLGIAIALVSFSLKRYQNDQEIFMREWTGRYSQMLRSLQHIGLVLILLVGGFFFCSTLANRYHNWEQAKVAQAVSTVAGDRLEQSAPQVRYLVQEPDSYYTQVEGKAVKVDTTRNVDRFLTVAGSQIQVKVEQATDAQNRQAVYRADFSGEYKVINPLKEPKNFFFEASPPSGYTLLQNFKVAQEGKRLVPINPGDYGFPFSLQPNQATRFRITYQAQGGSRWVYNAGGQLLSNFRLNLHANFPGADFASGIIPTETKLAGQGTLFTWVFDDNVSVTNPFGVFTAIEPIRNTGLLPRLLLLAPAILLWWLLLLYLSIPFNWRNVALAGGVFFACVLVLTYASRFTDAKLAWSGISLVLILLSWGLGTNRQAAFAAVICTIAGAILPVLGLLIPYSGITLSMAALLSAMWLAVRNWYKWA